MGIRLFSCSSTIVDARSDVAPNPNPFRFSILKVEHYGKYDLILAKYHGCTTFDGLKLMIVDSEYFVDGYPISGKLDPHFLDKDHPVKARFEPTETGYNLARAALNNI